MAQIYTQCGRYDEAIEQIEIILALEGNFTVNDFKLDDSFDPLRGIPKFQALMKKYELKSSS